MYILSVLIFLDVLNFHKILFCSRHVCDTIIMKPGNCVATWEYIYFKLLTHFYPM